VVVHRTCLYCVLCQTEDPPERGKCLDLKEKKERDEEAYIMCGSITNTLQKYY
jgi:hypothetical protein